MTRTRFSELLPGDMLVSDDERAEHQTLFIIGVVQNKEDTYVLFLELLSCIFIPYGRYEKFTDYDWVLL